MVLGKLRNEGIRKKEKKSAITGYRNKVLKWIRLLIL